MKAAPFSAIAIAAWALISCATNSAPRTLPPINGMIYDYDNLPVASASVSVDGYTVTSSDVNRRFALSDYLPGKYEVIAEREGYEPVRLSVQYDDPTQILYIKMFSVDQLLSLAEDSLGLRDWQKTDAFLRRVELIQPISVPLRYMRAALSFRKGDTEGARAILDGLLAEDVNDPYIHLFLADISQYRLADDEGALRRLDEFLDLRYDPEIEKRRDELKSRLRP